MGTIAENVNVLGRFCGMRDIASLTAKDLSAAYGVGQADVMVLFGGSILAGADVFAQAIQDGIAKTCIIVGGEGHTTKYLRETVMNAVPDLHPQGASEADIFNSYIQYKHGVTADYLERHSTNCGNNVTLCLDLLHRHHIRHENLILIQDSTMQRRMEAGFRKYLPQSVSIINYAAYKIEVEGISERLGYDRKLTGMWDMEQYMRLLMGEIPRLRDDSEGYGPAGKDYIAHVDIPDQVLQAFDELHGQYGSLVRMANPKYRSS
ncbi:ElyC/SanA/YdcF family protein [Saccharibacillus sacchari]|uniref:ElyC/SanA/YdcF family protein n=1 Tax=Saccharibacillus sacchari TaxID=456493 RepID=A0ACC6PJV1_9BACL